MSSESVTTTVLSSEGSPGTWHGLGLHASDVLSNYSGINTGGLPLLTRDPAAGSSVTQSLSRSKASLNARRAPLTSASERPHVEEEEGVEEGERKGAVDAGGMPPGWQTAAIASRCKLRSLPLSLYLSLSFSLFLCASSPGPCCCYSAMQRHPAELLGVSCRRSRSCGASRMLRRRLLRLPCLSNPGLNRSHLPLLLL